MTLPEKIGRIHQFVIDWEEQTYDRQIIVTEFPSVCQLALPPRIYSTAARSRSRWSLSRSRSFSLWLSLSLSTIAAVALWWEGCPVGSEKEKTQKQNGVTTKTALYICCTLKGPSALLLGIADRDMITLMCNYCTDIQMYMNNTGINPLTKTFHLIHASVYYYSFSTEMVLVHTDGGEVQSSQRQTMT